MDIDPLIANKVFNNYNLFRDQYFPEALKSKRGQGYNFLTARDELLYNKQSLLLWQVAPNHFFFGRQIVVVKSADAQSLLSENGKTTKKHKQKEIELEDKKTRYLLNPDTKEFCVYTPNVHCYSYSTLWNILNRAESSIPPVIKVSRAKKNAQPVQEVKSTDSLIAPIPKGSGIMVQTEVIKIIAPAQNRIFEPDAELMPSDAIQEVINRPFMYPGIAVYDRTYFLNGSFYQSPHPKKIIICDEVKNFKPNEFNRTEGILRWLRYLPILTGIDLTYVPISTFQEWKNVGSLAHSNVTPVEAKTDKPVVKVKTNKRTRKANSRKKAKQQKNP